MNDKLSRDEILNALKKVQDVLVRTYAEKNVHLDEEQLRVTLQFPPIDSITIGHAVHVRVKNRIEFLVQSVFLTKICQGTDANVRKLYEDIFKELGFSFDKDNNIIRTEVAEFIPDDDDNSSNLTIAIGKVRLSYTKQKAFLQKAKELRIKFCPPDETEK